MNQFVVESFLYSTDFGEDDDLLATSSIDSDSDKEYCCCQTPNSEPTVKLRRFDSFAKLSVPRFADLEFRQNFRINKNTFKKIELLLQRNISSKNRGGCDRITSDKTTCILLWYLGNQETLGQMSHRFQVDKNCIYNIVKSGTKYLASNMRHYVRWPKLKDYPALSRSFHEISKIKRIIGAVEVSNVRINKPTIDPEKYFCKNKYYGLAVQAISSFDNKFTNIFISEGVCEPYAILNKSSIPLDADNGLFKNYFLVGSNCYPNLSWLVTPFRDNGNLTQEQSDFNGFHKKAQKSSTKSFGYLKGRFPRLRMKLDSKDLPFIVHCIQAACVIHNISIDCGDNGDGFFVDDKDIFEGDSDWPEIDNDEEKRLEVFKSFQVLKMILHNVA